MVAENAKVHCMFNRLATNHRIIFNPKHRNVSSRLIQIGNVQITTREEVPNVEIDKVPLSICTKLLI